MGFSWLYGRIILAQKSCYTSDRICRVHSTQSVISTRGSFPVFKVNLSSVHMWHHGVPTPCTPHRVRSLCYAAQCDEQRKQWILNTASELLEWLHGPYSLALLGNHANEWLYSRIPLLLLITPCRFLFRIDFQSNCFYFSIVNTWHKRNKIYKYTVSTKSEPNVFLS